MAYSQDVPRPINVQSASTPCPTAPLYAKRNWCRAPSALHEAGLAGPYRIVAINEPADLASITYLTRFDSTHGRFPGVVDRSEGELIVDGHAIQVSHASTPEDVDWAALELDLVVECSGQYGGRRELQRFIDAGCPRLLLSHPGNGAEDVDATVVFGINEDELRGPERLVSNASCTTNAVVPVLDCLHRAIGIEHALLTTLHSAMNDQPLIDGYHHADLRRTRSAMQSIIPVSTGLARGVERLLPALAGRVQAKAIRSMSNGIEVNDASSGMPWSCHAAASGSKMPTIIPPPSSR